MAGTQFRRLGTAVFAFGLAIALICGHAVGATGFRPLIGLVNTVIGIGGSSDPLSERLPLKLNNTVVPPDYAYIATEYPASLNLDRSVRIGMPVLHQHLVTTSGKVLVAGYSLGALLVEQLKRDVVASADPPAPQDLSFLQIATPFIPNGGIFARFPGFFIPDVVSAMGPGQPSQYDTTYIVNEYDLWGDFPAYVNPISILNAVLGHEYAHVDAYYDPVDPSGETNHVKVLTNSAGGTDTYILVPNQRLPLLGPLRDIAYHLGISPLAERLLGAVEPLLKVIVDMGYTDRLNLNPEKRQALSLFTPPHKIAEALRAIPAAIGEGLHNLVHGPRTPGTASAAAPEPDEAADVRAAAHETQDGASLQEPTTSQPAATADPVPSVDAEEPDTESDPEQASEPDETADTEPLRKGPRTVPSVRKPSSVRSATTTSDGPARADDKPSDGGQDDRDAGAEAA
ncbi:PE-PPE domain-containing protein [Mycobacterium sp. NPDC003323]